MAALTTLGDPAGALALQRGRLADQDFIARTITGR
jgi:hypothetical protein